MAVAGGDRDLRDGPVGGTAAGAGAAGPVALPRRRDRNGSAGPPVGAPPLGYRRRQRAVAAGTWSRERVLAALEEWVSEVGRAPRAAEWSQALPADDRGGGGVSARWAAVARWPSAATVQRYFGSWSAALEQAGLRRGRLAPWELDLRERVATARRLSAAGVRVGEIARLLEVSASTVSKYLRAGSCPGCGGPLVSAGARRCQRCAARRGPLHWSAVQVAAGERAWVEDRVAIAACLRELGQRLGRRPTFSDLRPKRPGLPSYNRTARAFGSFAAALAAAGFAPPRTWTREQMLAALWAWTELHGRRPSYGDWARRSEEHPDTRAVARLFGSWTTALRAAELAPGPHRWQREEILEAIRVWADEHGRPPTGGDWRRADPTGRWPCRSRVERAFGAWSAALVAAGFQPRRRDWSTEQTLRALRAWAATNGRPPRTIDWQHPRREHPRAKTAARLFGSWEEALLAAGLPIRRRHHWQPEQILEALRAWADEHGRPPRPCDWERSDPHGRHPSAHTVDTHFPSWQGALLAAELPLGGRRRWRRDEILDALRRWAAEHGRPPTSLEWGHLDPSGRRPARDRVLRAFGTWADALLAAGFQPRRRYWPQREVLAALRGWAEVHDRPPRADDWQTASREQSEGEHPNADTVARLFGAWEEALLAAGLPIHGRHHWQSEQILEAISAWTNEHGRPPRPCDWKRADPHGRRPTRVTITNHFPSWTAALNAALSPPTTAAARRSSRRREASRPPRTRLRA